MKYSKLSLKLGISVLAFGLSGWASGACLMEGTNAASVQADSGNGTYNCSLISTPNGFLHDVTSQVTKTVGSDGKVTWTVPVNATGYPIVDIDLVSVASSGGKRCNYNYPDQPATGAGLSTSDNGTPKYVTFCADGFITPEPPPPPPPIPEPISTIGNGCTAGFSYDQTNGGQFDVAIGYTKNFGTDGFEGAAVCAKGAGQNQCINECVPHEPTGNCTAGTDGKLPLDCRACEYEGSAARPTPNDLKYCWYYENHVNVDDGTFKPSPKKKSLSAQIDVTTGSDCYTVTVGPMYGGRTYSYQYCPPAQ